MNKIAILICVVAVALIAVPAFASVPSEIKNDCLLYGKNCSEKYSLPERISQLKVEIAKGEKVYSPVELSKLKNKLEEDSESMKVLQNK